jgi:hypothetical protein
MGPTRNANGTIGGTNSVPLSKYRLASTDRFVTSCVPRSWRDYKMQQWAAFLARVPFLRHLDRLRERLEGRINYEPVTVYVYHYYALPEPVEVV